MTDEALYTRIEEYLDESLPEGERELFEAQLKRDSDLQREVDLHRQARKILDYENYTRQKAHLSAIERQMYPDKKRIIGRLAIAASLLLVITVGTWFWSRKNYSDVALATRYFATSELEVQRSPESGQAIPMNEEFMKAQKMFREGNYPGALEIYNELASAESDMKFKAEWNILTASLASGNCNADCEAKIALIARDKTHPYNERAVALQKARRSLFHRIAY